jgi:spermidine synthase
MLSTFLFGIGIGSILFAPFIDRRKSPLLWFAILELIIGISTILSVSLYKELPFIFLKLQNIFSQSFWLFSFIQFLLCSAIMIIPTLCMGAIFPTVSRIYTKDINKIGQSIGNIYFFNTIGAILGSFVGGFIMIPFIGVQLSIILTSATSTFLGVLLLILTSLKTFKKAITAGFITIAFVVFVYNTPSWDKMIMTLGPYVNPLDDAIIERIKTKDQYGELLLYKEGINAIITVRREADGRTISYQSNGKHEARSVDSKPGKAWSLLGHMPMLLSKEANNALLVGLGSGITLGAMEQYPLKEIDVVEIEPAVVEAAGYFSEANNNALDDPRVKLHIRDGRNFLLTTQNRYDVIVSAVSDPWITGVSNLFTREYFEELSNKLNYDGIVTLWFQNYRISNDDFKIGLNTFASVFPYVSLWFHYSSTADLIVIGSKSKHFIDMNLLYARFGDKNVRRDLARIEITDPFEILNLLLIGNSDIRSYIKGSNINTDDRPILEFTLPMLLYTDPGKGPNERIQDLLANARDFIPPVIIPYENKEDFYFKLGVTYAQYVFREEQAISLFERVLDLNPEHREAREYLDALQRFSGIDTASKFLQ